MNRTIIVIVLCLLCRPIGGAAAEINEELFPVSLAVLIEEALAQNPEVLSFQRRWEAAREEIPLAGALEDPELSLTQWAIPSNFNVTEANETWVGIGQRFPFPGKLSLRREVARKGADATEQEYMAKVREMTARVKLAYYRLFLIQRSIDLHLEHERLLAEFARIADHKYALGQVSQQDLLKAHLEQSKLHNSLLVLEQEESAVRAEINALLYRRRDKILGRLEYLVYHPFTLTLEELLQRALKFRPELKAAGLMIEKSIKAKSLARKNYLPDFTVEIMYWNVHSGTDKWMAVGKINLPWMFRGKYEARVRQAIAEEAQARADLLALENRTLFEIRDLYSRVKTAGKLIEVYQSGVLPQAEQALEAARIGYQAGKVGFLDLIDSERTLLDFRLEYVGALVQFWQSVADLERSVGNELSL